MHEVEILSSSSIASAPAGPHYIREEPDHPIASSSTSTSSLQAYLWPKVLYHNHDKFSKLLLTGHVAEYQKPVSPKIVNLEYLREHFLGPSGHPVVISAEDGGWEQLGWEIPHGLGIEDIAREVGGDTEVRKIDSSTQTIHPTPLTSYASTFPTAPEGTNLLTLEMTGTPLGDRIKISPLWGKIDMGSRFRKKGQVGCRETLRYCMLSKKGSCTNWHVDYTGSIVYNAVYTGRKVFYAIPPTPKNLEIYLDLLRDKPAAGWLGEVCGGVVEITVEAGQIMLLPAGWIHAVYTPEDSIMFAGNGVTEYDVLLHCKLFREEVEMGDDDDLIFPDFGLLYYRTAQYYLPLLSSSESKAAWATDDMQTETPALQALLALSETLLWITDDKRRCTRFLKHLRRNVIRKVAVDLALAIGVHLQTEAISQTYRLVPKDTLNLPTAEAHELLLPLPNTLSQPLPSPFPWSVNQTEKVQTPVKVKNETPETVVFPKAIRKKRKWENTESGTMNSLEIARRSTRVRKKWGRIAEVKVEAG